MMKSTALCIPIPTNTDKNEPYDQYYIGKRDAEKRRNGQGENHWTGPESLEWYTGRFLRNTMHGVGDYRWKYRGEDGIFVTYEGHFYANRMHGYGTLSYPDGRVFTGLFYNNLRWGPGVETHVCLSEEVGLWLDRQLVRLAWCPPCPSVAPDLVSHSVGRGYVEQYRTVLTATTKSIGKINSALDLLKKCGSEPQAASENWTKLYPKHCTDLDSKLCHVDVFKHSYYKGKIQMLEETSSLEAKENDSQGSMEKTSYFAWNNSVGLVKMMKHSYMHDEQRKKYSVSLTNVLSGPRSQYKRAGKHELDCRTLLMASYLGHIANVAQLVNEHDTHPDISDMQGNTALMYATCGDQAEVIHFLVEAGADVDSFNDACCTPLGVALIRFACAQKDISPSSIVQAVLPPPVLPAPPLLEDKANDWHITREIPHGDTEPQPQALLKSQSKIVKVASTRKIKSAMSIKDLSKKSKIDTISSKTDNEKSFEISDDKHLYNNMLTEFLIKVTDNYSLPSGVNPVPYIFEVQDMIKELDASEEEQKKPPEKNPKKVPSKVVKGAIKLSKEVIWQSNEKDESSIDSVEKFRMDILARNMLTILQLLSDGADPRLVRCPAPALFIAIVSGSSDLIRNLIHHGADVNEVYPQALGYRVLDVAVSRPFTYENLDLIRALLENGADANHRFQYFNADMEPIPGPTLLHTVLARKTETEIEEEIRRQVLDLLLEYKCDASALYKGRSAFDVAIAKNVDVFDVFIKSPRTDLNCIINESHQTILVKMFSLPFFKTFIGPERLQILTNLLLFGADPLIECKNEQDCYPNIFVFAKKTLASLESSHNKPNQSTIITKDVKGKKPDKPLKDEKLSTKSIGRMAVDDVGDYKQALELVTECARLLHMRWLQGKLVRELIAVIVKYKHRPWNTIMREYKRKRSTGLWLNVQRCLEIWDILSTSKRKIYNDRVILKHLLCIVQYCNKMSRRKTILTGQDKRAIEYDIANLLYEYNMTKPPPAMPWTKPYVKPELVVNADKKFNVCFECALPLESFEEDKIRCKYCKLITFCCFGCMRANIDRVNCHPCSDYLRTLFFPSSTESEVQDTNLT